MNKLITSVFILLVLIAVASSTSSQTTQNVEVLILGESQGTVAYIYKNPTKIDNSVISKFESLNYTVQLIQEGSLPSNWSSYEMIFVGDENFQHVNSIPVGEVPSIVANYYHGDEFGFTNSTGLSQLGSAIPLIVQINSTNVTVYTSASDSRGVAIPYYYIDNRFIAASLERVALSKPTSSGRQGAVIAYAEVGDVLENEETVQARSCFFGVVRSSYWTPEASQMFTDCVNFAAN